MATTRDERGEDARDGRAPDAEPAAADRELELDAARMRPRVEVAVRAVVPGDRFGTARGAIPSAVDAALLTD